MILCKDRLLVVSCGCLCRDRRVVTEIKGLILFFNLLISSVYDVYNEMERRGGVG